MPENNSYVKFPNELLEKLMTSTLSNKERRILDFIWRYSKGCNNEWAQLSHWNDLEHVGIYKGDIKKSIQHLENENITIIDWVKKRIKINEDFSSWSLSRTRGYDPDTHKKLLTLNIKASKKMTLEEFQKVSS